jgi:hypothetical protein
MGVYITVASVRRTVGILVAEISDVDVEATITEVEKQVPRFFNTVFAPTERIDILDGDGTNRLLLDKNPVLSVRELKIDGTTEDPANLEVRKESGYIFLGSSSDISRFTTGRNKIVVRYIHGTVGSSATITTSSAAEVAGTNVSIALGSITGLVNADWVEIYGMDGHREVAQINAVPGAGAIQVDQLIQSHVAGSKVVKLEIDENFKKLMNIIASIALVARIIGQSYTDIVGYTLAEMSIQKGEPYTQWRETANQFIKERDEMMSRISIRPYIV